MTPFKTFTWLLLPATLALAVAGCGISKIGGGSGGSGGSGAGGSGASGGSGAGGDGPCGTPDPASFKCEVHADCGPAEICSTEGCAPTACECDAESGEWLCTQDCRHACVPDPACAPPDTVTCADGECPDGYVCNPDVCAPDSCDCQAPGTDCPTQCIPVCTAPPLCDTPNPAAGACLSNSDCLADETCVEEGCQPVGCVCEFGNWMCDEACAGHCTPN